MANRKEPREMEKELFDELVESIKEMNAVRAGKRKPVRITTAEDLGIVDVAKLRRQFALSQAKFAALLGISLRTLQGWEQGRRKPKGAEQVLLRVAAKNPKALLAISA